jgi:hypothetical protein
VYGEQWTLKSFWASGVVSILSSVHTGFGRASIAGVDAFG